MVFWSHAEKETAGCAIGSAVRKRTFAGVAAFEDGFPIPFLSTIELFWLQT